MIPEKSKFDKQQTTKRTRLTTLIQYTSVRTHRTRCENCVDGTAASQTLNQAKSNHIRRRQTTSYLPSPHSTFLCCRPRSLREQAALPLLETKGRSAVMLVTLHTHGASVSLKSRDCTCLVSAACHVCRQIGFTHLCERGGHAVACEDEADIVSSSYCVRVLLALHAAMSGFAYSVQKMISWKNYPQKHKNNH